MTRDEFVAVVDRTLDELPDWVVDKIDNLHVDVEEHPPPDLAGSLGVYEGVSLLERAEYYSGFLPDRIVIFRQPHMQMALNRADLESEIRKTVLHEIAHHLGIEDDRLSEMGWD